MRPARPPKTAPNGQRFDPSASPIPAANKRPATQLEKDQTGKLNSLGDVGSGGVFIIVLLPNVEGLAPATGGDLHRRGYGLKRS